MPRIKGSKTEKNLLATFAGESQARNRYAFAASAAKKEEYIQISRIFEETAENEKEHAKRMFKFLEGGPLEITAVYPAGKTGKTLENLEMAADGEHEEHTKLYPSFAKIAREEGFEDVAKMYEAISIAEKQHEKRYRGLIENLKKGTTFKKSSTVKWRCSNCGYIHEGKEAASACPACQHPQGYFEVLLENW